MLILKTKFYLIVLVSLILPAICWAVELDILKADFLQGNYRRVIFEGQAQVERINFGGSDELNYILGLSYLKEEKLALAQNCFRRILDNPDSKFKAQATLGLADTYLIGGHFQEAEDTYNKLITNDINSSLKAAVLYRLSQSGFKRGNNQRGNEYLFKLRRDFPLSPELRLVKGLASISIPENDAGECSLKNTGEYSVQIGFFTNSANANSLKDKLLAKNYSAYVEDFNGGYRVRVGKFKLQKEALDLESKLLRDGFPTKVCP
jgi:tetratricopeptide (TPR) repeat protein